jgi:hypothetical protein
MVRRGQSNGRGAEFLKGDPTALLERCRWPWQPAVVVLEMSCMGFDTKDLPAGLPHPHAGLNCDDVMREGAWRVWRAYVEGMKG